MNSQISHVMRSLERSDVRYVRLWFTDVLGFLKTVAIAPAELESAFEEGVGFDGSAVEGFARVYEADMVALPDPSTFQLLPWQEGDQATARMFCDILLPDKSPSFADPRHVLKRALKRAAGLGFTFYTHPEIEFYLFNAPLTPGVPPTPVDNGGYFDHTLHSAGSLFRRDTVASLEAMGISVEFSHHEGGPGQHEIDLRYSDALTTADDIVTFRMVAKEVAASSDIHASFLPKPLTDQPGSGMHTHMSLFEGDRNAFFDASQPYRLSVTARRFIAGLLHHARDITAITNQWVNSYKRLAGGAEAPSNVCWGHHNRSAMVRIPRFTKASSARIELRTLDAATNPYLALAVVLHAGLDGIENEWEPPQDTEDDVWSLTEAERRAMGFAELPRSLGEAIRVMEESDVVVKALGEHVYEYFLRNKRAEFEAYRRQVTPKELEMLPIL